MGPFSCSVVRSNSKALTHSNEPPQPFAIFQALSNSISQTLSASKQCPDLIITTINLWKTIVIAFDIIRTFAISSSVIVAVFEPVSVSDNFTISPPFT
mmetsp:Transcript_50498/g.93345  ORF Transcript_50498/g.93345 Transcript_50498/m.93345 type:complete len:98 (+) Transcript_50498:757-1050(+)